MFLGASFYGPEKTTTKLDIQMTDRHCTNGYVALVWRGIPERLTGSVAAWFQDSFGNAQLESESTEPSASYLTPNLTH